MGKFEEQQRKFEGQQLRMIELMARFGALPQVPKTGPHHDDENEWRSDHERMDLGLDLSGQGRKRKLSYKDRSRNERYEGYEILIDRTEQRPDLKEQPTPHTSTRRIKSSKSCKNGPLCRLREKGLCVRRHSDTMSRICRYGDRCRNALEGKCIFLH